VILPEYHKFSQKATSGKKLALLRSEKTNLFLLVFTPDKVDFCMFAVRRSKILLINLLRVTVDMPIK
jgi:hypothetical protein